MGNGGLLGSRKGTQASFDLELWDPGQKKVPGTLVLTAPTPQDDRTDRTARLEGALGHAVFPQKSRKRLSFLDFPKSNSGAKLPSPIHRQLTPHGVQC